MFNNVFKCSLCLFIAISSVNCNFDLPIDTPCEWEGVNGTCVHMYNCLGTVIDLKNKKNPKICSFQDKIPVVCCTDCEKTNDTSEKTITTKVTNINGDLVLFSKNGPVNVIIDTDNGVFFRTGQKARDHCVEHASRLPYKCKTYGLGRFINFQRGCNIYDSVYSGVVVGGMDAERFKYPHMALLGYGPTSESAQWLCGGSLISDRFVLTAAHCISSPQAGQVTFAALGLLKRTDAPELWQRHKVIRAVSHPEYKAPSKYHDIALLEIEPVKNYSTSVFPACLNFGNALSTVATATGWGMTGKRNALADNLQEVNLLEFSAEECAKQYPVHRYLQQGYDHRTQLCYGDTDKIKDTCRGDSGGPIQVTSTISKCIWNVVGVTSSGKACGYSPGDSGLYTRVSYYVPWIESVVWP